MTALLLKSKIQLYRFIISIQFEGRMFVLRSIDDSNSVASWFDSNERTIEMKKDRIVANLHTKLAYASS